MNGTYAGTPAFSAASLCQARSFSKNNLSLSLSAALSFFDGSMSGSYSRNTVQWYFELFWKKLNLIILYVFIEDEIIYPLLVKQLCFCVKRNGNIKFFHPIYTPYLLYIYTIWCLYIQLIETTIQRKNPRLRLTAQPKGKNLKTPKGYFVLRRRKPRES